MSLKLVYGTDRLAAEKFAVRLFGADYELFEAEHLRAGDLDSLFFGTSLFGSERRILVKNLNENSECWEAFGERATDFAATPHLVLLWLPGLDKRQAAFKVLSGVGVEMKEFKLAEKVDRFASLNMLDAALRGDLSGMRSKFIEVRASSESAFPVIAAISTTLAKKHLASSPVKAARALKILAKYEMRMKTKSLDEWVGLEGAMVEICLGK